MARSDSRPFLKEIAVPTLVGVGAEDKLIPPALSEEMAEAIETGLTINAHSYFYKPLRIEALLQALTQIDRQELSRRLGRPIKKK